MARNNTYKEKTNPVITILYYTVLVVLFAALVLLYRNYRIRQNNYTLMIQQAAASDSINENVLMKRDALERQSEAEIADADQGNVNAAVVEENDEMEAAPEP